MKKLIFALIVMIMPGIFVFGQTKGDYKKFEFFAGFSNGQVDKGFDSGSSFGSFLRDRANFRGFNVSGVYNVSRYVGIKGDVSGTFNKARFSLPVTTGSATPQKIVFDTASSLYNFLGGVQVKDNASKARFKPFAHAMVGVGYQEIKVKTVECPVGIACAGFTGSSKTGLAAAFGGGLDTRITKKLDFRAFQVDYNPIKFSSNTDHNTRFGTGIVF